jgi:cholesterol oxidase
MPVTFENWYAPGVPVNVGIIGSLGMLFDETNRGKFAYPSTGKVGLQWARESNADAHAAIEEVNQGIATASHTITGTWPFVDSVNAENWTAHPLGGAVIGLATDNYGRTD